MNSVDLHKIINRDAVCVNFEAANKREAITYMSQLLCKAGAVSDVDGFVADVFFREMEGQTGIGDGIAVPHGKSDCVSRSCVALGRLKKPIAWESIDDQPVSVIFLFAVQNTAPDNEHLRMMATIARALAHEEICEGLRQADSREALLTIVDQMSSLT